jgi:hypothetical protein
MGRFLILYNSPVSAREAMAAADPEQARAGMEAWMAWAQKAGDALVDLGTPTQSIAHVGSGDGDPQVAGYSIMEGESGHVEALLAEHPHGQIPGNSIDVLELLPVPGQ